MSGPSFTPAIEVKILDPRLKDWGLPQYQSDMAAAIDLYACSDAPLEIAPQDKATLIPSGFALYMNDVHMAAVILPRSGLGHKQGLVLGNGTGLIDPDYTAQIFVSVWNRNPAGHPPITINPGDRIAQMMFLPVIRPNLSPVEEFSGETARGGGGFGSTGTT